MTTGKIKRLTSGEPLDFYHHLRLIIMQRRQLFEGAHKIALLIERDRISLHPRVGSSVSSSAVALTL
jgi:hypothetical protein